MVLAMPRFSTIIWTNHAVQRLKDRGLSEPTVVQAIRHADTQRAGKRRDTVEYSAEYDGHIVTAVTARSEKDELIVISCWVDPPFAGTKDWFKKQRWLKFKTLPWWQKMLWRAAKFLKLLEY